MKKPDKKVKIFFDEFDNFVDATIPSETPTATQLNKESDNWKQVIVPKPKSITVEFGPQVSNALISYFELQQIIEEEIAKALKRIDKRIDNL